MDSGQPGPTVVIVGGTHSNEIAGISAALLIVERAEVTKGGSSSSLRQQLWGKHHRHHPYPDRLLVCGNH